MSSITLTALQKQRRDTAANWTSANPTLLAAELGYETDTGKWKVGDGTTAWTSLAYTYWSQISAYPLATADIANDAITADKLAHTAVTAGSYTAADITVDAQGRITAAASGTIGTSEIADGAVTSAKLDTNIDIGGTLDVTGVGTFDSNLIVQGNLTVNGTTTTIDTTTLVVEDKNIELGSVATPTDVTADGGGITLKGATDKTINWVDSTDAWTFSEHINIASGKEFRIAGTKVLDATSLGSAVVTSSLTSVGTITTGTWNGTAIATDYIADDAVTADKLADDAVTADKLADTGVTGTSYGSATQVPTFTVDAQGRLTAAADTAIAVGTSAITSGTLAVDRGGTGANSYTDGQLLIGNSTGNTLTKATLTGGTGVSITNGGGSITISSSGATGPVLENLQTINTNYTLTSNYNAISAGPVAIDTGVTVTVPSGALWAIV